MSALRLGRPLATCDVAIPAPDRVAVRMAAARRGRWPGREAADRLGMAAGACAWSIHRLHEDRVPAAEEAFRRVALGVAGTPQGPLPGDLVPLTGLARGATLALVPWDEGARPRVRLELEDSARGPVAVLRDAPEAPAALVVAALGVVLAAAGDADPAGRMALALAVEGVLAWYREAHRMTPARDAVRFALVHATSRLKDAGRPVPPDLADA